MVRTTTAADDESTTTRRTRADLRALPDFDKFLAGATDVNDFDRVHRLVDHNWLTVTSDHAPRSTRDVSTTADGHRLAGVVDRLANPDVVDDDLDYVIDIMGMADFVDAATRVPVNDSLGYFRGLLALVNAVDEARHDAGTSDDEFDHDGLFAGHFADFDARKGTVEVRFERKSTARSFADFMADEFRRFDVTKKHDERFTSNRNPRRFVVDVLA